MSETKPPAVWEERAHPPRLLIAEDDALQGMWLTRLCEQAGFEVEGPFVNERDALGSIGEEPPDLAIIDFDLRGENSHPVNCVRLVEELTAWGVPFAIYSSHQRVGMLPAGAEGAAWLTKPASPNAILACLERLSAQG
jgi:DNA-binding response OmpR family regulator